MALYIESTRITINMRWFVLYWDRLPAVIGIVISSSIPIEFLEKSRRFFLVDFQTSHLKESIIK